jgi:hypothetical protein
LAVANSDGLSDASLMTLKVYAQESDESSTKLTIAETAL